MGAAKAADHTAVAGNGAPNGRTDTGVATDRRRYAESRPLVEGGQSEFMILYGRKPVYAPSIESFRDDRYKDARRWIIQCGCPGSVAASYYENFADGRAYFCQHCERVIARVGMLVTIT